MGKYNLVKLHHMGPVSISTEQIDAQKLHKIEHNETGEGMEMTLCWCLKEMSNSFTVPVVFVCIHHTHRLSCIDLNPRLSCKHSIQFNSSMIIHSPGELQRMTQRVSETTCSTCRWPISLPQLACHLSLGRRTTKRCLIVKHTGGFVDSTPQQWSDKQRLNYR